MGDVPLLELKQLSKVYDNGKKAVSDVSFEIPPGKLVGLIGPNGCGKTTLMRCVNKMHSITEGDVLIDGESVLGMGAAQVARMVSNVPAEIDVPFGMNVFDAVMLGRYPYLKNLWWETEEDEAAVTKTLENFGVLEFQDRKLDTLSSGELQRVLIAKAYVQEPRLMLVDEPTSHLDMKYKLDVMEYLSEMVENDMTILVAEHDISLMARYCDLCLIMKDGRLVAMGDPKEIITEELIYDVYDVSVVVGFDRDDEIYVLPKRYRRPEHSDSAADSTA